MNTIFLTERMRSMISKLKIVVLAVMMFFSVTAVCYAGDVPESALTADYAKVYFGQVTEISDEAITVTALQNIKGEFEQGSVYDGVYSLMQAEPKIGEVYLCLYLDEANPLYMYEVTSTDTKTLKLKSTVDMAKRLEEYLNNGDFERAEQTRLEKLNPTTSENGASIGIIGGADGPTAIFVSGGTDLYIIIALGGVILGGVIGFFIGKRYMKK